jgi:hypothetical protein
MLHFKTIDSTTLELLKKLMKLPVLTDTRLVGGTSLALQSGYRKSFDIDLFGTITADEHELSIQIGSIGESSLIHNSANIHIWMINGIKADIVNYHYSWISKCREESGLRLAGKEDIAAMKLSAITGRGTKRDFFDLYFLLKEFTLEQMLQFYLSKFPDGTLFLVLKSLSYFEDAEENIDPILIKPVSWKNVKSVIVTEIERYFSENP